MSTCAVAPLLKTKRHQPSLVYLQQKSLNIFCAFQLPVVYPNFVSSRQVRLLRRTQTFDSYQNYVILLSITPFYVRPATFGLLVPLVPRRLLRPLPIPSTSPPFSSRRQPLCPGLQDSSFYRELPADLRRTSHRGFMECPD